MPHHQVQRNVPLTPPSASEASEREQNLKSSAKKYPSDQDGDDDYCDDVRDHHNRSDGDIICSGWIIGTRSKLSLQIEPLW